MISHGPSDLSSETSHSALDVVVVPVDGSSQSERAVPFASRLASALDAELVVVSVVERFAETGAGRVAHLRGLVESLPEPIERRVVESGAIAPTILAESDGALVVIASSGEPFDVDGWRYSVADELVRESTAPTIVMGPACAADPRIDRIIVAHDPAHDQAGLAYWSVRLGYLLDVPVEIVHVASEPPTDIGSSVRVISPSPGENVASTLISEADGALLALGSHGHVGFRKLVEGSVGGAAVRAATQPLMILGPHGGRPATAPDKENLR